MARIEDRCTQEYTWLLPGEAPQVTFDNSLNFASASSLGDNNNGDSLLGVSESYRPAGIPASWSPPGSASMSESLSSFGFGRKNAKNSGAQLSQGTLASLLTAAGNTFHGRDTNGSSTITHQQHHHGHHRPLQPDGSYQHHYPPQHQGSHTRSRTHPHHARPLKYPPDSSQSSEPLRATTRVVITNFRICSVSPTSSAGPDTLLLQVALGAIASIAQQDHRIDIALKFDSPRYILSQHPCGPPAIHEAMSILRRSIFSNESTTRFPYQMGQALLSQDCSEARSSKKELRQGRTSLWTAEDIIALSPRCHREESRAVVPGDDEQRLGWTGGYDIAHEFRRLKFDESLWSVAHLNGDFELSPTYPERFIMPKSFLDDGSGAAQTDLSKSKIEQLSSRSPESANACVKQLAAFRSNRRFPIVCWRSPDMGLVLMRSSQPMVGFLGARGPEDELYIRMILNTAAREQRRSLSETKSPPRLFIMDARAYASAVANGYVGGGRENPDHYPNASISYMSLGNIHVIASSHQALLKAISGQADSANWYTVIESTGWLTHVTDLLKAAADRDGVVGRMLEGRCSVLVHCTDGWDRTTQLVSLAQILLDPYYRTIHGLRVLIEKEWVSSGHPFQSRTDALPDNKKVATSAIDDEPIDSWRPSAIAGIQSSPNGAKEVTSFARKWRKQTHPDPEPKLDTKPIPSFSYHMETRPVVADTSRPRHSVYPPASAPSPAPSSPPAASNSPAQQRHAPVQTVPLAPSPVFLLFLTCLHHIVQQHPNQFEYNDYLLVVLARAASGSSPFGDFLCNSERERSHAHIRQQTPSIWKWVQENRGWFTNRDFLPDREGRPRANFGADAWRDHVLQIQTGGRFTSLWTEYYFNTAPVWYPDPRTVLSRASAHKGSRSKDPLYSAQRREGLQKDPWYSSQFNSDELQQLAFPGLHSATSHYHREQQREIPVTIPPALALLKGQDMHLYYLLVQHLKARRKRQVKRAFLAWRHWANRRREEKPARDAGWIVDGVSGYNSSQEEEHDDAGNDEGDGPQVGRRTPELTIVAARRGIEATMGRILDEGPFFGGGPLSYEQESEDDERGNVVTSGFMRGGVVMDTAALDSELDGAFDDFGFPVGADDKEGIIAV